DVIDQNHLLTQYDAHGPSSALEYYVDSVSAGLAPSGFPYVIRSPGFVYGDGALEEISRITLTTGLDDSSTTFDGAIRGNVNLTKVGPGTWALAGVSPYSGTTSIQGGVVALGVDNALPPRPCFVAQGATLDGNGHSDTLGPLSGGGQVLLP